MQRVLYKALIKSKVLFAFVGAMSLHSCSKDLESENLLVFVPIDQFTTEVQNIHFKWEPLQGADFYELEIVRPSFDSIVFFIADTTLTGEEFYLPLSPGNYEWRMRAGNGGSYTPYIPFRRLRIDTTSDLTGQSLTPLLPTTGGYTNDPTPTLSWTGISFADSYTVEVRSGSSWSTGVTEDLSSVTSPQHTPSALPEGQYYWGVYAENNRPSSTATFTSEILIDLTTPGAPFNLFPDGTTESTSAFTFSWNRAVDNGTIQSPVDDSLFIYNDVGLTSLYKRVLVNGTSFTDSIQVTGTYYWMVKSFDEAGNIGNLSNTASVTIQ